MTRVRATLLAVTVLTVLVASNARGQEGGRTIVVLEEGTEGARLRITLRDIPTGFRWIEITEPRGILFPTIDLTCDGRRQSVPLRQPSPWPNLAAAVYLVPDEVVARMLNAVICRVVFPGVDLPLTRAQVWAAWAAPGTVPPRMVAGVVVGVVDGETIRVKIGNVDENVRYNGVEAPVFHPGWDERNARAAAETNRLLTGGRTVRLELDTQERNGAGDLLAYVYVGETMVNAELLRRGWVHAVPATANRRYDDLFARIEHQARTNRLGLWAPPEPVIAVPSATQAQAERSQPGTVPEEAWTCPSTHQIKGTHTPASGGRCVYHMPDGPFYSRTKPDRCYMTEEEAKADGCRQSRR